MARQWVSFDGAVVHEDGEEEYVTFSGAAVSEDQPAPAASGARAPAAIVTVGNLLTRF